MEVSDKMKDKIRLKSWYDGLWVVVKVVFDSESIKMRLFLKDLSQYIELLIQWKRRCRSACEEILEIYILTKISWKSNDLQNTMWKSTTKCDHNFF